MKVRSLKLTTGLLFTLFLMVAGVFALSHTTFALYSAADIDNMLLQSTVTTYTCPSGDTHSGSGSSTTCTKTVTINASQLTNPSLTPHGAPTYTYECPRGYTSHGSGASMTCSENVDDTANLIVTTTTTSANTAVRWDTGCYANMHANRSNGQSPRSAINNGGAYNGTTWISSQGQGSETNIQVPYGTKVVNLQLNTINFLCSPLVQPDNAGADYASSASRIVSQSNYPDDIKPNAECGDGGSATNCPAYSEGRFYIHSWTTSDGGTLSLQTNRYIAIVRSDNHRYWFATPLQFTYTAPASEPNGLTSNQTITVTMKGYNLNQFGGSGANCINNTNIHITSFSQYSSCPLTSSSYTINVVIAPYYSLTPAININNQNSANPGTSVTVTPTVTNVGNETTSNTNWELSTMTFPEGAKLPAVATGTDAPCDYFQSAAVGAHNCSIVGTVGQSNFAVGANNLSNFTVPVTYPPGTQVCYALSVQPNSSTAPSGQWAYSVPVCLVVGEQPLAQIWGSDLWVGRSFVGVSGKIPAASVQGSTIVDSTGRTFGSWVEYGIFATGGIAAVGSSAAYASPGLASATPCLAGMLSFSLDAGSTTCNNTSTFGNYSSASNIPDIASDFPVSPAGSLNPTPSICSGGSATLDLSATHPQGVVTGGANCNLTISAGSLAAGQWLVINAPSTNVTITGNLTYANGPFTDINQLPQLVIIAKNITINDTVTNVDAWLIAEASQLGQNGVLETCQIPPPLTISNCSQQLVVHGPVMAQTLEMLRTYQPSLSDPAEIFDLRPDAYLWLYNQALLSGHAQTVYTQELPPRL